jgi:hypothetical protein
MSQAAGKGALTLGQRLSAWAASPTGPRTTHFWGPVANWGFVIAVGAPGRIGGRGKQPGQPGQPAQPRVVRGRPRAGRALPRTAPRRPP